ncbi:MAG: sugar ABC transporter ATP-binding protein [Clostridiales Family XIII bacterium]|jgi:ABC-type sugar transport system ATPase subunit|nr:sugar ABC transporter ATP-binding protein [Clostridiales Family XIII bacterium]
MRQELLRLVGITKSYYGVKVLNGVNLNILKGETVVLMGQNGAGKSTLIRILCGLIQKNDGRIYIDETPTELSSPAEARNVGIHSILQEPMVAPNLTVAENIFLYSTYRPSMWTYRGKAVSRNAELLLKELGISMNPDAYAKDLSMSQQFLLFVAMVMCMKSKLIIMDETTASMNAADSACIYNIIEAYKSRGNAVLLVTQDIQEAIRVADRIAVLRDGSNVGMLRKKDFSVQKIVRMMTGKDEGFLPRETVRIPGREVLRIEHAVIRNVVQDVSISVRAGEVVGVAGLVGSGKSWIAKAAYGLARLDKGNVYLMGERQRAYSACKAVKRKIAYIPEQRIKGGVFGNLTIEENIVAAIGKKISVAGFMKHRMSRYVSKQFIRRLDISVQSERQQVNSLSGGNQQKLIVSRSMAQNPVLLIADEPTNGLDITTKEELKHIFCEMAESGVGVLLVSSNMQEILSVCDRVVVMSGGRIKCTLSREEALCEGRLAEELY